MNHKSPQQAKTHRKPSTTKTPTKTDAKTTARPVVKNSAESSSAKKTATPQPKGLGQPQGKDQGQRHGQPQGQRHGKSQKRSFSQQTLNTAQEGPLGDLLTQALHIPEESGYSLTHGFHPYPGRFHPALPRTVLAQVAKPGETLLDPFMGGGTTLVEGMLQGLKGNGNDLNPVALLVARERTCPRDANQVLRVNQEALRIAGQVEALRQEKNPPRLVGLPFHQLAPNYQRHLLAELMQWLRLIRNAPLGEARQTLEAVFSSAVIKFSNQRSDTDAKVSPTSYPKGAVSRFMVKKTEELTSAQRLLAERLPPHHYPVRLHNEDARLLPSFEWGSARHIITSPPYPGTYDYLAHHSLRMAWLGLDDTSFQNREIGARRDQQSDQKPDSAQGWSDSLREVFSTLARVMEPGGNLFLVIGDWITDNHAVDAAGMISRQAEAKDWKVLSRASAQRAVFSRTEKKIFAKNGKWEHLLHLKRADAGVADKNQPG